MPTSPSNTARYFLDYSYAGTEERTLQVRYESPATPADVAAWLDVLLSILEPQLATGWTVLGARVAAAGSNVTLPTTAPAAVTPGGGAMDAVSFPLFIAGQGRDAISGAKARLSVYGVMTGPTSNYRLTRGETGWVGDVLDFLQTPVAGVAISIAGNVVQWYDYLNVGYNAYHQRNQRT